MTLAVLPLFAVGSAHAADAPVPAATPYAQQVDIGTAVKIGAAPKAADTSAAVDTTQAADPATATETPSGAVVLETESHQAASATPSDTSVAVLGTKTGADTLASTGPSHVTIEFLLALALLGLGLAMRNGSQLATATRRLAVRRH